jgi:hypothetical protein
LGTFVVPHHLVQKVLIPENLIHLHLDIVAGVPVAVDIDAARLFQQPFHLVQAGVEPNQVAWHPAFPNVGERAHLVLVAEDDVILPAREEGRVDVNHIDALAG